MSSSGEGKISIAIALVAPVISTLALYRSWSETSAATMTPAQIDGVDATP